MPAETSDILERIDGREMPAAQNQGCCADEAGSHAKVGQSPPDHEWTAQRIGQRADQEWSESRTKKHTCAAHQRNAAATKLIG